MPVVYNPAQAALEIREQLASGSRRLGFLIGAGTSMAVGLPGIEGLTANVGDLLEGTDRADYQSLRAVLPTNSTIEDVLNRVRLCRELLATADDDKQVDGLTRQRYQLLDGAICQAIYNSLKDTPVDIAPHLMFAEWLRVLHASRDTPVEIFSTNYDAILEVALETRQVPYFDGFIGALEPFFAAESVETDALTSDKFEAAFCPPRAWTRLWKVHGSISWRARPDTAGQNNKIIRVLSTPFVSGEELMIYPTREKYQESRRLPFVTLQDRLRRFLISGETLLVITGYGFADQHLNDIIFEALRRNTRLAICCLVYGQLPNGIADAAETYPNFSVYASDAAVVSRTRGQWTDPPPAAPDAPIQPFWNAQTKSFTLGDFSSFARFLDRFVGHPAGQEKSAAPSANLATESPA